MVVGVVVVIIDGVGVGVSVSVGVDIVVGVVFVVTSHLIDKSMTLLIFSFFWLIKYKFYKDSLNKDS